MRLPNREAPELPVGNVAPGVSYACQLPKRPSQTAFFTAIRQTPNTTSFMPRRLLPAAPTKLPKCQASDSKLPEVQAHSQKPSILSRSSLPEGAQSPRPLSSEDVASPRARLRHSEDEDEHDRDRRHDSVYSRTGMLQA